MGIPARRRPISGIFVSRRSYLEGRAGGVQLCTNEYLDTLRAAGVDMQLCAFDDDRRWSTRVVRQLTSSPYFRPTDSGLASRLTELIRRAKPDLLLLNQVAIAGLGERLAGALPRTCQTVLLSHGLESTDLLHTAELRKRLPLSARVRPNARLALAACLAEEQRQRAFIDKVCTLSAFDAELERWIGAKSVAWFPRQIHDTAIAWRPAGDRIGFVGTLDHAPNLDGLVAVLSALAAVRAGGPRVRIVGGPSRVGRWLAALSPAVDYLGELDDVALVQEAESWNAFINPLFRQARGCSTKLATAISWQLPIVTTTLGRRGYEWREGHLAIRDDPASFADVCVELCSLEKAQRAQREVVAVARSSPTLAEVGERMRAFLSEPVSSEPQCA